MLITGATGGEPFFPLFLLANDIDLFKALEKLQLSLSLAREDIILLCISILLRAKRRKV